MSPAPPSQPVPGPSYPPGAYAPPPGPYTPPPGAVMVAPGQPYPYGYPPPGPYSGPVIMSPPVLVPAPPLPSYQWSALVDALFLERSSGGSIPLGTYEPVPVNGLYSDDSPFPLEAGIRLEISRKFDNDITLVGYLLGPAAMVGGQHDLRRPRSGRCSGFALLATAVIRRLAGLYLQQPNPKC